MKSFQIFILLAVLLALAKTSLSTESTNEEPFLDDNDDTADENSGLPWPQNRKATSWFLPTCDKYPKVCRVRGSPGPDCCQKRCVNMMADRFNCGYCGKMCKYWELCCEGKCVNPRSDKKHCGGCNNKCKKGSKCEYGMCSYA